MKVIYITLTIIALVIAIMLVLTFYYLDQQRRQSFLYALYYDDVLSGYEKIDRYMLEDRMIYKSLIELPRDILKRQIVRKTSFDARGKKLIDYTKKVASKGAEELSYLQKDTDKISFLSSGDAKFLHLNSIPTYGNDLVFENESVVTYLSLMRRYNFKRRGEQFVNILSPLADYLPPVRQTISIMWVSKDFIEIEDREVNCERLNLQLKNGELISVWLTRGFHNILMIEIPSRRFKALLCNKKKDIPVKEYRKESTLYIEKEVGFANEEIPLYGTLTVPTAGKAPYPTVMLIWGWGLMDRDALGIFTDLAHALAEAGYCVFRFDKRGIGQSQGFLSTYAQPEEISDLKCAVASLKSLPEVDKSRIALLGHSEGGFYASYITALDAEIRSCVIMSALSSFSPIKKDCEKLKRYLEKTVPDDEDYRESVITAIIQNRQIIKDKGDWITIMGNRVFTKKMGLEDRYNPIETIKKVRVPVLILHGRKDDMNLLNEAQELSDVLASSGNDNFTTIYFGGLDHFFADTVQKPPVRDHLELDIEVSRSITAWLDKNLIPLQVETLPSVVNIVNEKTEKAAE